MTTNNQFIDEGTLEQKHIWQHADVWRVGPKPQPTSAIAQVGWHFALNQSGSDEM